MQILRSESIADLYRAALCATIWGYETHPRGFKCLEAGPITMVLNSPHKNILTNKVRNINQGFMAAEFAWIVTGRNDVAMISKFNSRIVQFSDDGKSFYGAYGPRFLKQFNYIMEVLERDPWTRQAVMTFWRPNPPKTKDVPCTIMLHFSRYPEDTLHLSVYMRSNDVWLGLPYDIHNFTSIQIMMAQKLGLNVGKYTHIDGSLHAYEHDLDKIRSCIRSLNKIDYNETRLDKPVYEQKIEMMNDYLKRKELKSEAQNT